MVARVCGPAFAVHRSDLAPGRAGKADVDPPRAVQGLGQVETLGGPRPVSLYCLTIAGSGERKSNCDALLIAALRRFDGSFTLHGRRLALHLMVQPSVARVFMADPMASGIRLAQFYLGEAVRLVDASIVSAEVDKAERLRRWLQEDWSEAEILPGDVLQRAPIRALCERPAARKAIATLEESGWLVRLPPGTRVRGKIGK
jgi:hypothetical protein